MDKEVILKKCDNCKALVKVLKDCNCNDCSFICCSKPMTSEIANSSDASKEKHLPEYKIIDNKIYVVVNHVMEEEHHIEWISYVTENNENIIYVKEKAEATFDYISKGYIYAYCNKHGLWKVEVK